MPSFSCITVRPTIALIIASVALTAKAGIDFTPAVSEYVAEGAKFQQLTFAHGKQKIEYELPLGWSFEGSPVELRLKPPKKMFAEAVINAAPLIKPQPLDQNAIEALKQHFIASVPPGSQFVKIERELQNVVAFGYNNAVDVTMSYQVMGEKFLTSALIVNLPDTQLTFRFTARKDDFELLQREFRMSIGSWHWLEADATTQLAATAGSVPAH
jgi:hypothetical protein